MEQVSPAQASLAQALTGRVLMARVLTARELEPPPVRLPLLLTLRRTVPPLAASRCQAPHLNRASTRLPHTSAQKLQNSEMHSASNRGRIAVLRYGYTRELNPEPRSRAAGWPGMGWPQGAAQGQYRLSSEAALHRRRGHPRHHHRRNRQALSERARGGDRISWGSPEWKRSWTSSPA